MTLSDAQKTQIRAFLVNPAMVEAVRAALMPTELFADGVDKTKDDAEYGRAVKVWVEARAMIEQRFNEMRQIAPTNPQTVQENPSR
jgi:hypothetical protein